MVTAASRSIRTKATLLHGQKGFARRWRTTSWLPPDDIGDQPIHLHWRNWCPSLQAWIYSSMMKTSCHATLIISSGHSHRSIVSLRTQATPWKNIFSARGLRTINIEREILPKEITATEIQNGPHDKSAQHAGKRPSKLKDYLRITRGEVMPALRPSAIFNERSILLSTDFTCVIR